MILQREEKDNKIEAYYVSTNILASTYDKTTNDLIITFNKGNRYKYPKVSLTDYTRFEMAESQGVVFNSHIKKYEFEKLDTVDANLMLETINKYKEDEKKILLEGRQTKLVGTMKQLTAESVDANGEIILLNETQLNKLQEDLNNFWTQLKKN